MIDSHYLDKSKGIYEDWNEKVKWVLLGVGFDSTETYLPGQRLAPASIREILRHKESKRLFNDVGDVIVVHGDLNETLKRVEDVVNRIIKKGYKPLLIGGEHSITYGSVKALMNTYKKLQVVVLDAHYDAYDRYDTLSLNHATVLRRIKEEGLRVVVKGARRFSNEEEEFASHHFKKDIDSTLPTYLSVDLDFFDPSIAPGVSDKESNGYYFKDFLRILKNIKNLVGVDVVELNPCLDTNKVTASLASDIILKVVEK